jgi:hypothetical protein
MAAFDLFCTVTGELTDAERTAAAELIARAQADLLAARSEEARVRIVHGFITDLHGLRSQGSRRTLRMQTP